MPLQSPSALCRQPVIQCYTRLAKITNHYSNEQANGNKEQRPVCTMAFFCSAFIELMNYSSSRKNTNADLCWTLILLQPQQLE